MINIKKFSLIPINNFSIAHLSTTSMRQAKMDSNKGNQEYLKLEKIPNVGPKMRFVDPVLVETNPSTGEFLPETDKNPTKWGDWQHNGRVSDF